MTLELYALWFISGLIGCYGIWRLNYDLYHEEIPRVCPSPLRLAWWIFCSAIFGSILLLLLIGMWGSRILQKGSPLWDKNRWWNKPICGRRQS
jgi:hypothetical protein